ADQVTDSIRQNKGWGSDILISDERKELLETGGGLLKAKNLFSKSEKFVTCNVDILTDLDLDELLAFHDKQGSLISFAVTSRKTYRSFFFDQNNRLCGRTKVMISEQETVIPHTSIVDTAQGRVVTAQLHVV